MNNAQDHDIPELANRDIGNKGERSMSMVTFTINVSMIGGTRGIQPAEDHDKRYATPEISRDNTGSLPSDTEKPLSMITSPAEAIMIAAIMVWSALFQEEHGEKGNNHRGGIMCQHRVCDRRGFKCIKNDMLFTAAMTPRSTGYLSVDTLLISR